MPKLSYAPDGADAIVFEFAFDDLLSPECIAIEKLAGMSYASVQQAFAEVSVRAIHAVLYVLLKRSMPTLTPDQLQFRLRDIEIDLTDDEVVATVDALAAKGDLSDEEKAVLDLLRPRAVSVAAARGETDGDEGKA